ncbi:MAG: hypothetical protein Q4D80_04850 [Pseudomonadota bacterium]|nr:hypothetical protein [Pseudomonadota bacterium]
MKKIFITLSSMLLAGCSLFEADNDNYWLNNVRPYKTLSVNYYNPDDAAAQEQMTDSKTLNTRTYKHNVVVSANLGQRMVDAQTYTVENFAKPQLVATADGFISSGGLTVNIHEGQGFEALGEVKMNGKYYLIVPANNEGDLLLVDERGKFLPMLCQIYHNELLLPREKAYMKPADLSLEQRKATRENVGKPKLQFEIKYDGLENGYMAFVYTDYSNASSSEGYFQRFVFPQEQDLVEINGVKFKVMDVYPERIEYMLLD